MSLLNASRSEFSLTASFQVFRGQEIESIDETRSLRGLVDAWLKSQENAGSVASATRRVERKLHNAIKSSPMYGKILSFAGLNLWVDDRTLDGTVMLQESINLG